MSSANGYLVRSAMALAFAASVTSVAQATDIYSSTIQIGSSTPTQLGRITRARGPSDWSTVTAFPGAVNTTTSYHYATFDLDIAALESGYAYSPYIQISFDSASTTTFLSAYLGSYVPTSLSTNYLGDEGSSGDLFGLYPATFQIVMPSRSHLILVLNESTTNGGLNMPGNLLVEAFADTQFADLTVAAVPEPQTWALLAAGLAWIGVAHRRRARRASDATTPTVAQ